MRVEWHKARSATGNMKKLEENGRVGGMNMMMGEGVMYVRVMTDEQMEVLRRQISVYATICEQLVEMHKAFTAQQDSLAGMRLGGLYCDPSMVSSGGHKITGRQRWTPTIGQLQILERMFELGNGAPSKQKIKEIALELAQHGQISETNVYNWFQNRRARSKRKQTAALPSNTESEAEAEAESANEKRPRLEKTDSRENLIQSPEVSSDVRYEDPGGSYPSNDCSKYSESPVQISYDNALSNQRLDTLGVEEGNLMSPYRILERRAVI